MLKTFFCLQNIAYLCLCLQYIIHDICKNASKHQNIVKDYVEKGVTLLTGLRMALICGKGEGREITNDLHISGVCLLFPFIEQCCGDQGDGSVGKDACCASRRT